jgi:hypothetical protein
MRVLFPCVSQAWAAALPWMTEKILTLFSVKKAGPKTRPFDFPHPYFPFARAARMLLA